MRTLASTRAALVCAAALCAVTVSCGKSLEDLGQFPCANDGTCPSGFLCYEHFCHAEVPCTDPVTSGACGTGNRCARVGHADVSPTLECIEDFGNTVGGDGVACAPAENPPGGDAIDGCNDKFACVALHEFAGGESTSQPACRKFCTQQGDCSGSIGTNGESYFCATLGDTYFGGSPGIIGLCQPRCTFLSSTSCSGTCNPVPALSLSDMVGICRPTGNVAVEGSCEDDNCQAGLSCIGFGSGHVCKKLCTGSGDCGGGTCNTSLSLAGGVGYCGVVP